MNSEQQAAVDIAALQAENEWGHCMGIEVQRVRRILRELIPSIKCDGFDLPAVVGSMVQDLQAENERLREALEIVANWKHGQGCSQLIDLRQLARAALDGGE